MVGVTDPRQMSAVPIEGGAAPAVAQRGAEGRGEEAGLQVERHHDPSQSGSQPSRIKGGPNTGRTMKMISNVAKKRAGR